MKVIPVAASGSSSMDSRSVHRSASAICLNSCPSKRSGICLVVVGERLMESHLCCSVNFRNVELPGHDRCQGRRQSGDTLKKLHFCEAKNSRGNERWIEQKEIGTWPRRKFRPIYGKADRFKQGATRQSRYKNTDHIPVIIPSRSSERQQPHIHHPSSSGASEEAQDAIGG